MDWERNWPVLTLDGKRQEWLERVLTAVLVEESDEGLYRCELTLRNGDQESGYLIADRQLVDFGRRLVVHMTAEGADVPIFDGVVMGLEGRFPSERWPELTLLADDRLQDLRMTRRTRVFKDQSDADMARAIAQSHGLSARVEVEDTPLADPPVQLNQSDLAFLRERAQAVDADVWVDGRTLHLLGRSRRGSPVLTLAYGGALREFQVLADLAGQRSAFSVTGWDPAHKRVVRQRAEAGVLGRELGRGLTSGAAALRKALGGREDQIVHAFAESSEEAGLVAQAVFRRGARRFLSGAGLARGDPRIRVGVAVDLSGLGQLFSGRYYVCGVRHLADTELGYRTEFRVERPGIGG